VKAGKPKSNGFSDLAVGPEESMQYALDNDAKDLLLAYTVHWSSSKLDMQP
jgi:hypothetical protein